MRYLRLFESLVDDRIDILKDLALELTDDDYNFYTHKCGMNTNWNNIPNYQYMGIDGFTFYDSTIILVVITYRDYLEKLIRSNATRLGSEIENLNLSKGEFKARVNEYIDRCKDAGIKWKSVSSGDYFSIITFKKWS